MKYIMYLPSYRVFLGDVLIPPNDTTPEYQAYLAWCMAGNSPTEIPDPIDPMPRVVVSMFHLMMIAVEDGIYQTIEDYILNSGERRLLAGFRHASEVYSDCSLIAQVVGQIGIPVEQGYQLFLRAAALPAMEEGVTWRRSAA